MFSMALILIVFRSRRPQPYLVAALAAMFPDIDTVVFRPLIELGYVQGLVWTHRGLTHSLLIGALLILLLSAFGPWRAAAVGFLPHVLMDFLTGGVRLLAPFDAGLYGFSLGWLTLNVLVSAVSVTSILVGLRRMNAESAPAESARDRIPGGRWVGDGEETE